MMLTFAWSVLTSRLAGPIATAVAVGLAVLLGVATVQKAGVERERDKLESSVEHPTTGWRARFGQCRGNVLTLEASVEQQNKKIVALGEQSAARLAAADAALSAARRDNAGLNTRLNRLLSAPATGATLCERVEQIDRAVLEAFQ